MRIAAIIVAMGLQAAFWAGSAGSASAADPPGKVDQSPAMAEAEANRPKMKVGPEVRTAPEPVYSNAERALGHAGKVTLRGIVGVDGRLTEVSVVRSNAGPVLDASALAAAKATVFSPAKDADGHPISIVIFYPVEFADPAVSPTYIHRVEADYPDAERLAGHFGKVVISGKIGADGRLLDAMVKESSRAPGLDAAAMTAAKAAEYRVYRDDTGAVVEVPVSIPFAFDNYRSAGKGGGILRYRCDQFVRDEDWWKSVWPPDTSSELYTMILGIRVLSMTGANRFDPKTFKADMDDFNRRWTKSIEACRARPDALMIDMLKPEGDWARRLAEKK